jgi:hypothetical protein
MNPIAIAVLRRFGEFWYYFRSLARRGENHGTVIFYRVDRINVESGYRVHEDQRRVYTLLCRANGEAAQGDGAAAVSQRV